MCSSSKFSCVMTMISDFMVKFKFIFLIVNKAKLFFAYVAYFLLFIRLNFFITQWYHFFFFVGNYFHCKLFKHSTKPFNTVLSSFIIVLFFVASNEQVKDNARPDGLCSTFFLQRYFQNYFDKNIYFLDNFCVKFKNKQSLQ